jgi:hypothetical protein
MRALDGRLRTARSGESVPPTLHASIMRAVRTPRSQRLSLREHVLRWLPVPALALLLVTGVWWASSRAGREAVTSDLAILSRPLPGVGSAWDEGRELTQTATFAVMAPLSGEMELLNRDLQRAVAFLADSLPKGL